MIKEPNRDSAIGIFDSGLGGLTVAREIMRQLPKEKIVYFGDTARLPYGSKSKETITRYSRQIINFLMTQDVKAIVIACNTASSYALESVSREYDIPIIGVIEPGARTAVASTRCKNVGVIGTEGTISSKVYNRSIHAIDDSIIVSGKACPLFVPLVEEGWIYDDVTRTVAERYLYDLKQENIDTLILGCTHYPLLRKLVGEVMGPDVVLVNPAYETARDLKALLEATDSLRKCCSNAEEEHSFFVSDKARSFSNFANSILPCNIDSAHKIDIEKY